MNVAIIEPIHFQVVSVQNFDTYNKDGGDFEAFLLNEVLVDDIIILFTFDEASKELDNNSKKLLYELGSGKIQNLHYRSQWYMISQKGIKGFTVYEQLNFAKSNKWAEVIDEKFCIPDKIPSQIVSPDPVPRDNQERVEFCQQFNRFEYYAFCEGIEVAFKFAKKAFPLEKNVIILEEGQILSPDFLFYMAQMIPVLDKDSSLLGISAWNPNGLQGFSSDPHSAYRVEEFPGLAFLAPIRVYDDYMEGKFNSCCTKWPWEGWDSVVQESGGNMIMPDLSRVLQRPLDAFEQLPPESSYVFTKQRMTNTDASAWIDRPQDLLQDKYFQHMAELMQISSPLHLSKEDLSKCSFQESVAAMMVLKEYSGKVFAVYFVEDSGSPYKKLETLCRCFGLSGPYTNGKPKGLYKNVLRFTFNWNTVLLVEATSPFYRSRPPSVVPL
ncbi:hypothetical protein J437_LFUL008105 [Ladona fulva]|uniref:Alpha-1,3-mannosyl-glycoprotein 2-beta-N-acetylglucosaminyltransferase n=1 Tax=Ladona fulva TaxID=123851 RepID=A0A8K0K1P3_LADFU|nr:hypothetical protein J437_LFUL008105 [Ladona fulva]